MPYCHSCGAATAERASFCAACGARLPEPAPPAPPVPAKPPAAPRTPPAASGTPLPGPGAVPGERPVGVTLVAVGFFALAVGALLVGLFMALLGPVAFELTRTWFGFFAAFASAILLFVAILALLFGALAGAIGYGLLQGRSWGWVGALVVAGLAVLSNLMQLAEADAGGLLGALVWGGLVYYLMRPEVRAWFGRG